MSRAWYRQWMQHGLGATWRAVTGPAGTLATILRRIGWQWPAWNVFLTADQQQLNCSQHCPLDIVGMANAASRRAMWQRWARSDSKWQHLEHGPFLEPVKALLARKCTKAWTTEHKTVVRNTVTTGLWTQQVRYEAGLADSPLCQLCEVCDGTPGHRLSERHVQPLPQLRKTCLANNWRHFAQTSDDNMLWERGITSSPEHR